MGQSYFRSPAKSNAIMGAVLDAWNVAVEKPGRPGVATPVHVIEIVAASVDSAAKTTTSSVDKVKCFH